MRRIGGPDLVRQLGMHGHVQTHADKAPLAAGTCNSPVVAVFIVSSEKL